MKRTKILSFAMMFVFALGLTSRQHLPATSWQTWNIFSRILTVHETDNPNSPICFKGKLKDYGGFCVSTVGSETPEYNEEQRTNR